MPFSHSVALQVLCVRANREMHRYFTEESRPYPPPVNTYVIGPCTGGFAAAALSCSQTLTDLVSNGVEAVLAAFRTALRSFLVGQSLSRVKSKQPNNSWSAAVSTQGDIDLEQLLNEFTNTKVRDFEKDSPRYGRLMQLRHFVTRPFGLVPSRLVKQ